MAASPGFAPGPPVSETGALLIMRRGPPSRFALWRGKQLARRAVTLGEGWSPGKVLPLRLLGVGQTRFYFTTGRKLAAGNGFATLTALSKSDELLITPSRKDLPDPAFGFL